MRAVAILLALALVSLVVVGCASNQNQAQVPSATPTSTSQPTTAPASVGPSLPPVPPPSDFVSEITNPWYPLKPGSKWVYRGVKDGQPTIDTFVVTSRKKVILGVPATVVSDNLTTGGRVIEATEDWYVQDAQGNVWYLGEATKELDTNGKVTSTEGSWQAGVDGAKPGIFMPANPQVGDWFYQEFYQGHAEDTFRVVSLDASVTVPSGTYDTTLLTRETTALEPGVVDSKNYVTGVGEVSESSIRGPTEYSKLVRYALK